MSVIFLATRKSGEEEVEAANPNLVRYFSSLEDAAREDGLSDYEDLCVEISSSSGDDEPVPKPKSQTVNGKVKSISEMKKEDLMRYLNSVGDDMRKSFESSMDEDLYTRVTSVLSEVSEGNINEKLKKFGITFDFLKADKAFEKFKEEAKEVLDDPSVPLVPVKGEENKWNLPKPGQGMTPRRSRATNQLSENKNLVKVCPECAEIAGIQDLICEECGLSLENVAPVPSKTKLHKSSQNGFKSTCSLAGSSVEKVSDSTEFMYDSPMKPQERLPSAVRAELSLNLRLSQDSSICSEAVPASKRNLITPEQGSSSQSLQKLKKKGHCISHEDITFEYAAAKAANDDLSADLRNELSLNLRASHEDEDSARGSRMKEQAGEEDAATLDEEQRVSVAIHVEPCGDAPSEECLQPSKEGFDAFVQQLMIDPRFKPCSDNGPPSRPSSAQPKPSKSQGRPKSAQTRGSRPGSRLSYSIEPEQYQRRWASSSVCYSSNEFSAKPSTLKPPLRKSKNSLRPQSAKVTKSSSKENQSTSRPLSAGNGVPERASKQKVRPWSAGFSRALLSLGEEDLSVMNNAAAADVGESNGQSHPAR